MKRLQVLRQENIVRADKEWFQLAVKYFLVLIDIKRARFVSVMTFLVCNVMFHAHKILDGKTSCFLSHNKKNFSWSSRSI